MTTTPPTETQRDAWRRIAGPWLAGMTPAQRAQVFNLAGEAVKGNTAADNALRRLLAGAPMEVIGAIRSMATWPAGAASATKALPRRTPSKPAPRYSPAQVQAGIERLKINHGREVIAAYVAQLPERRKDEILSDIATPNMIENTTPDHVLRALDHEGNYRYTSGNLRDQASREAILKQNILHQRSQKR